MIALDRQENPRTAKTPEAPKPPLRVGLLIDSYLQPRWVHQILSDIAASAVANLVLIVSGTHTLNCADGLTVIDGMLEKR